MEVLLEVNKMRKSLLVVFLLVAFIVIGGCETQSGVNSNGIMVDSFRGGSEALTVAFEPNMPPDTIRDQGLQLFSIRLKVTNSGEADIPAGKAGVKLSGFDPAEFNLSPEDVYQVLPELRGYKKQGSNEIQGTTTYVLFNNLRYVNDITAGTLSRQLFAFICYPYETKAVGLICVKSDTVPSIDEKDSICTIDGDKQVSNSGAPVKVENLKEYAYGEHSVQIQFDIVKDTTNPNLNVYEPGSVDVACNVAGNEVGSVGAELYKNKIKYTVETGISGLDCEGTGTNSNVVMLSNNRYTVTCVQDTSGQVERDAPVKIILDYDVIDRVSKVITIEHIAR